MLTNAAAAVNVKRVRCAPRNLRYKKVASCEENSKKTPYSDSTNPLTEFTLSTPSPSTLCYMLSP
jgi:hypothetical protein